MAPKKIGKEKDHVREEGFNIPIDTMKLRIVKAGEKNGARDQSTMKHQE